MTIVYRERLRKIHRLRKNRIMGFIVSPIRFNARAHRPLAKVIYYFNLFCIIKNCLRYKCNDPNVIRHERCKVVARITRYLNAVNKKKTTLRRDGHQLIIIIRPCVHYTDALTADRIIINNMIMIASQKRF